MVELIPPQMVSNIISFENSNRSIPLVCQQLDEYTPNGQDLLQALKTKNLDMLNQIAQARNFDFDQTSLDQGIIKASKNGYLQIVELLLTLGSDPSTKNNNAIRSASENGHLAVVERLLKDPRVDPSAKNNNAIRLASVRGYLAVVERLLQDARVNPSAENNEAIRNANKNEHLEVVKRLLQDPRVNPRAVNSFEKWLRYN